MKKFRFLVLVSGLALLASCTKTDQATGVGDALIVSKKSGTNTVYGVSLYAYTFSTFQSVKAVNTLETGKTYNLNANQGYKTNFFYDTPDAEFSTTKPATSTFNFSAVFENGNTDEFDDILSDKALPIPVIEKCEYNSTDHRLEVTWTPIPDADSYAIHIMDASTLVFGSVELPKNIKTYAINTTGGGWAANFTPVSGKSYAIKVFAFMYEPGGDAYNVQASSVVETTAIWGN